MERRWDSSEPSGRSRGKVVRKIRKLFFGKGRNSASRKLVEKKNSRRRTRRVLQADRESGERLMNFVLVGSKVCLFLESRQCCDEVS
jgi:hypothetical protein